MRFLCQQPENLAKFYAGRYVSAPPWFVQIEIVSERGVLDLIVRDRVAPVAGLVGTAGGIEL
jgi:hypothetical protein